MVMSPVSTEVTLTLRYDFGSLTIDLSEFVKEIKARYLPEGTVTYMHMQRKAAVQLLKELRIMDGVGTHLYCIERKMQLIHSTFTLDSIPAGYGCEFTIRVEGK